MTVLTNATHLGDERVEPRPERAHVVPVARERGEHQRELPLLSLVAAVELLAHLPTATAREGAARSRAGARRARWRSVVGVCWRVARQARSRAGARRVGWRSGRRVSVGRHASRGRRASRRVGGGRGGVGRRHDDSSADRDRRA